MYGIFGTISNIKFKIRLHNFGTVNNVQNAVGIIRLVLLRILIAISKIHSVASKMQITNSTILKIKSYTVDSTKSARVGNVMHYS